MSRSGSCCSIARDRRCSSRLNSTPISIAWRNSLTRAEPAIDHVRRRDVAGFLVGDAAECQRFVPSTDRFVIRHCRIPRRDGVDRSGAGSDAPRREDLKAAAKDFDRLIARLRRASAASNTDSRRVRNRRRAVAVLARRAPARSEKANTRVTDDRGRFTLEIYAAVLTVETWMDRHRGTAGWRGWVVLQLDIDGCEMERRLRREGAPTATRVRRDAPDDGSL